MLMAGLDGIKNKVEPPEPIDKDLYDLPPEDKASVKQVPGDLDTQCPQLLYEPPHFRTGTSDLLCELGPADDGCGVVHQDADNSS